MLLFLIDGLSACALSDAPFLAAHYLATMTNVTPVVTAPNWMTLLTGLTPKGHGVFDNKPVRDYRVPTILDDVERPLVVSDWRLFRSYFKHVPFVYTKSPFRWLETHDISPFDLVVINVQTLDHVGHRDGWESAAYRRALRVMDAQVSRCVGPMKPWLLTSDHGGRGRQHDAIHDACIRSVPLCGQIDATIRTPVRTTRFRKFVRMLVREGRAR